MIDLQNSRVEQRSTRTLYGQRLLRLKAVEEFCGLKRTQIYEHIARGEFPKPIKLTEMDSVRSTVARERVLRTPERPIQTQELPSRPADPLPRPTTEGRALPQDTPAFMPPPTVHDPGRID